ncbi:hypothetical protein C5Y93_11150 [Blastopirellula marina]|uniref:Glycosyl hydrolase family 98 putative carbohydrate-binding module domain-containing protein n=1 Tax=Blastopirellula marina TaxID=124 RepID=A0A2S8GNX8_9BACT|nr:hypothetical protein C5Y93_11150 [Blastopirellula marina]
MILVLFSLAAICLSSPANGDESRRFVAMLEDGRVVEDDVLRNWYSGNALPQLGGQALLRGSNAMRWMMDREQSPAEMPTAYIELFSGDRLPGRTLSYHAEGPHYQADLPEHFSVAPSFPFNRSNSSLRQVVRVRRDFVRKIVWQQIPALIDRYVPATLFLTNGREIAFRAIRFDEGSIHLLAGRERMSFGFHEIAELHLDASPYWDRYLNELAILFPGGKVKPSDIQRLVQWETADGLVATTSVERIDAESNNDNNNSDRWTHGIQPAWSLDTIWIACRSTWMWRSWNFDTIPLFRLPREETREGAMFSRNGFPARINRAVLSGTAQSGEHVNGWNIGVMAPSRIVFPLPPFAKSFQTRLGIDRAAADRGCVKGKVRLSWESSPKFESSFLVGSQETVESGMVRLADIPADGSLILEVDPAHEGRPAGADPFDIRDMTNWIEPMLVLDEDQLREEIEARTPHTILAWKDWTLETELSDITFATTRRKVDYPFESPSWRTTVASQKEPIRVVSRRKIAEDAKFLEIVLAKFEGPEEPNVSVQINGIPVFSYPLQNVNSGDYVHTPPPYLVNVTPFAGQEATIEVTQSIGPEGIGVDWRGLHLVEHPSFLFPVVEDPTPEDVEAMTTLEGEPTQVIVRNELRHLSRPLLEIPPGEWIQIAKFDRPIEIRERPWPGQFRQIRMSVAKPGNDGHVLIRFLHDDEDQSPAIYSMGTRDAGKGIIEIDPRKFDARKPIAENWVTQTQDLYSNFKGLDITGIAIKSVGESSCLVDHVHFAATAWDFNRQLSIVPDHSNWDNWEERSEKLLPGLIKATLVVQRPGKPPRPAILFDQRDGYLAMLGDHDWQPGTAVEVIRHDGKKFPAKLRGMDAESKLAVVQIEAIEQDGQWQQYNLSGRKEFDWKYSHLVFQPAKTAGSLAWDICRPLTCDGGTEILTKPLRMPGEVGAIAVDRDHQISGFVSQMTPNGQPVLTIAQPPEGSWEALKNQGK